MKNAMAKLQILFFHIMNYLLFTYIQTHIHSYIHTKRYRESLKTSMKNISSSNLII